MQFLRGCFPAQISWFDLPIKLAALLGLCCGFTGPLAGQKSSPSKSLNPDALQKHYDAARTYALSGDQQQASEEYRAFLADAMRGMANAQAHAGNFEDADKLFGEAVTFTPNDPQLLLDWAAAYLANSRPKEAQATAEKAVALSPTDERGQFILGRAFFEQNQFEEAKKHLEQAVAKAPSFEIGYLLAVTYLKLKDTTHAQALFDEMISGLGDTVPLRLLFGRAYRDAEYWKEAIEQFKQAIAKHPQAPQAHYFLGLAYLGRDNDSGLPEAIPEFQAEVRINPNDYRAHYMLGYGLVKRHDNAGAEKELTRAIALDPTNPDPLIYLAQLYSETDRKAEAEAAARKAIALTTDESHNDYEVSRAHYLLGRMLIDSGSREQGIQELTKSEELRKLRIQRQVARQNPGDAAAEAAKQATGPEDKTPVSPKIKAEAKAYIDQLKPNVAEAYNNLGVAAAGEKDYKSALGWFEKAAAWDPSLDKLDRNLGMASYYANAFAKAVAPLERELQRHPDDVRVRATLGLSYFSLENYTSTLRTLEPVRQQVDGDPGLSAAYAVSLIKTGKYDDGMARLRSLEKANPDSADIHTFLGTAFADQGIYATAIEEFRKSLAIDASQQHTHFLLGLALIRQGDNAGAVPEMRAALRLNPSDVQAKYHLAFALIQIGQKSEGRTLLNQVIQQDKDHADAYYQIGKLQLEDGDVKGSITSLETATHLSPESEYMHYQLAMAYRRDSRPADAEREMAQYQALKDRRRGGHEQTN
jgi:tetratricopeptide (TPR) repeat protein